MNTLRLALAATTALSLAACSAADGGTQVASAPAAPTAATDATAAQSEHDRLFALFAAADEKDLELNPLSALFRGDMRYADRLGDFLTDEYNAQSVANAQANLARLEAIDREALNPTDRIAYDVFEYNQRETLRGFSPAILAVTEVRPVNHFSGFHTFYPTFASGEGTAPFKTLEDYENNLKRHTEYVELTDRAIAKFREGEAAGIYETKLTIGNVIEQLDTQLALPLEESPLWGPVTMFPESFSASDKTRLTAEYRTSVEAINAAHTRLRDYLRDQYLPKARDTVGLSQMKGGEALYEYMIESTTTLPLTADELHRTGLAEV